MEYLERRVAATVAHHHDHRAETSEPQSTHVSFHYGLTFDHENSFLHFKNDDINNEQHCILAVKNTEVSGFGGEIYFLKKVNPTLALS